MAVSCASVLWRWSSRHLLLRVEAEDGWSESVSQQRHERKHGTYRWNTRHAVVAEISHQRGVLEWLVSDVGVLHREPTRLWREYVKGREESGKKRAPRTHSMTATFSSAVLVSFERSVGRQCFTFDPSGANVVNSSSRRCRDCFRGVFFF